MDWTDHFAPTNNKLKSFRKAIHLMIDEIKLLDKDISLSQGINPKNGLLIKIGKELFTAYRCPCEYKMGNKFLTRLKYKGQLEPEYDNTELITKLNKILIDIDNTPCEKFEDFYFYMLELTNSFQNNGI
jgi:hypothetical protein